MVLIASPIMKQKFAWLNTHLTKHVHHQILRLPHRRLTRFRLLRHRYHLIMEAMRLGCWRCIRINNDIMDAQFLRCWFVPKNKNPTFATIMAVQRKGGAAVVQQSQRPIHLHGWSQEQLQASNQISIRHVLLASKRITSVNASCGRRCVDIQTQKTPCKQCNCVSVAHETLVGALVTHVFRWGQTRLNIAHSFCSFRSSLSLPQRSVPPCALLMLLLTLLLPPLLLLLWHRSKCIPKHKYLARTTWLLTHWRQLEGPNVAK